jgi:hypothetical protein
VAFHHDFVLARDVVPFHFARQLFRCKRAAFLKQNCSDQKVREEVEALLNCEEEGDRLLEGGAWMGDRLELTMSSELRAHLPAGTLLGRYEIVALIGAGGMGEVYRARDVRLKRDVAIKVLPADLARDPDRIARFEREARAAGALDHPNIVSVYDIGCENGVNWTASELIRGDTLRRLIEAVPLPPRKAIEIATQVAAGLAAAHATGLVHRDLKPENIMVTRDGQAKILDFGLAKQRFPALDSTTVEMTNEGAVLGTVGYMSPEQVRGQAADHRSDLFSFGVVLYETLCGKRAFSGASSVEVMNAILKDDPEELPASVPLAFVSIARRCLEKEPDRRFQSAADLGFALQTLALSPSGATRPEPRRWWKWAALLAVCAIAGIVYWLVGRSPKPTAAQETTLRRLTNDPGMTTDAAISPDGKLVAYVRDGDIWVRQVDARGVIRITDDPADDRDPAFSPDGAQVAFHSEREGGGIYVASALGGEARQLAPMGVPRGWA